MITNNLTAFYNIYDFYIIIINFFFLFKITLRGLHWLTEI